MTAARRLLALGLLLLASSTLRGQETRATLLGSVKDPSGSSMPGVAIEIVHRDNGVVTRAVTNTKGYFELSYLSPGTYDLVATLEGFKQYKRTGIALTVNARSRIDIEMTVGGVTDTVVVTGDAPLLETATASGSQALSAKQVETLPFFGDGAALGARSVPGVQWLGQPNYVSLHSNLGASQVSAAGGVGGVEYALDGVPNLARVRRLAYNPSTDTIQEIRVDTAPFDASKGHTAGATISMLTKSGTNELHGSLSWAHWQQRWNGTDTLTNGKYWGAIRAAEAKGDAALASQLRSQQRQPTGHSNDYSATLGGPVKRNKLFAFLTFNGYQKNGPEETLNFNRNVPSEAHRRGDFSDLLKIGTQYQIYDPRTARLVNGSVVRDPFPNNQVPILNPIYQAYTALYPLPNGAPNATADGGNNYLASATPWNWRYAAGSARLDWMPSQKHRLFGKFSWNDFVENRADWTYETALGLNSNGLNRDNIAGTLDWVFGINATTVLNVSVAYNRYREGTVFTAMQSSQSPGAVGLPGYMDEKAGQFKVLPRVNFSAYTNLFDRGAADMTWYNTGVVRADLTRVMGTHSVRTGLDFREYSRASYNAGNSSGRFEFRNDYVREKDTTNNAATRGLEWAAFMLGVPTAVSIDTNDSYYLTQPTLGAFVQDDWRVSSKLTLNLGVRFEVEGGFRERYNRGLGQFDTTAALPISAGAQAAYQSILPKLTAAQAKNLPASISVVGGSTYLGKDGQPSTLNDAQLGVMPRLGLAYQITRKTVFRAGYGLFFDTNSILNEDGVLNQSGFSRTTPTTVTNDRGLTFVNADLKNGRTLLSDPFPVRADGTRFLAPLGNTLGLMQVGGGAYDFVGRDWKRARQQRFRASIQQEITSNMVFEVVYLGSRTDNISLTQRLNPLPEQFWASGNVRNDAVANDLNAALPNPFALSNYASLQSSNPTLYADMASRGFYTGTTIRKNQLLRDYPQMAAGNGLRNTRAPLGEAKYDHIELTLQKRFASGMSFVLSYVRAWDQRRDWLANEFDTLPRWVPSGNSAPHHFMANAVIELPFGKGKRFFKGGVLGSLLGGWRLGPVYHLQSNTPYTFGNSFWYGDTPKDPLDPNDPAYRVLKLDNPTRERAFNVEPFLLPSARAQYPDWATNATSFAKVVSATAAVRPADFHRRVFPQAFDFLRGDGMNQLDLSVTRAFSFGKTRRFELRADVINLLNTVQWRANPTTDPYATTFGQLSTQWNTPRWITLKARLVF